MLSQENHSIFASEAIRDQELSPHGPFAMMSAFPIVDICIALTDVRFGSKADMCSAKGHVRFTPESDVDCVFRYVCLRQKRTSSMQALWGILAVLRGEGTRVCVTPP